MPISFEHKFKFIHIPKTGGSSIEEVFSLFNKKNFWRPTFIYKIEKCYFAPQHLTHNLLDHFSPESKDWFSFTYVRNPYTKIVSEYFYIHRSFYNVVIDNFTEDHFKDWIVNDLVKFDMDHKLPQSTFIDKEVDMVLKFENIQEDFKKLCNKLNVKHELTHTQKDKGNINKNKIVEQLSKETKDLIYNIFKKDFEMFNYSR